MGGTLLTTGLYVGIIVSNGPGLSVATLVLSCIWFAPIIFILGPIFAIYILRIVRRESVVPGYVLYIVTGACVAAEWAMLANIAFNS
jgi:hypothetical protein